MMKQDVNVVFQRLPNTIKGFCINNPDTTYTVVLNANATHEQRMVTYQHELDHILNNDHSSNDDIDTIENKAHKN